jgi:hypothetical protein
MGAWNKNKLVHAFISKDDHASLLSLEMAHSLSLLATTGNALYLPYREKKDLIEDLEVVFIAVLAVDMIGGSAPLLTLLSRLYLFLFSDCIGLQW